ncbi:MAG: membrane protein insertase YidC [Ignavibacteria bacterium]|jgi:YidC/Oxa1 family membrane protein insertase|nr:membrane protein insertase YidC [Ignavibacteria bacterium]MCU7503476.1 membrane protein insertase YidC [Ignavibacteria bacterium]MCU7516192.1 membrane protein insertase YidC [Ignavibacteria bacterium]
MDKQTTIAFVIIGAILIVWLYLSSPTPQNPPAKKPGDSTLVNKTAPTNQNQNQQDQQNQQPQQQTSAATADTSVLGKAFASAKTPEEVVTIENDLVKLELTSKGGRIRRYFLKKYNTWYADKPQYVNDFYERHVQLINNDGDFNLIFVSKDGKLVNTSEASFQSNAQKGHYVLQNNDSLLISYTLPVGNGYIRKTYVFHSGNYAARCDIEMKNMANVISNYRYDVAWENGINFVEKNSVDEANYSNASAYAGDEQVIVNAKVGENSYKEFNGKVDWITVRNKYFTVAIAPLKANPDGGALIKGTEKAVGDNSGVRKYFNTSLKVPFNNSNYQKNSFLIYIGPVDYSILKSYGKNFERIVDFGSLFGLKFIIRPISEYLLLPLFVFLHNFIPNYGFVIIVFSLIIKIALHPLTRSSMKSMKKMQLLQPKIAEIKEKFKDDPQKVNKETMRLYSTYGINPAGGCLPMLLQMPILVALWGLFNVAIELRQQPFALWIHNLSVPDVIFDLGFKIPLFGINQISGLALLLGITMFIQQKMSVKDPSQQALVYMMPILFTVMFMGFPAGLNLYYFMFNLFSIAQQYYINHSHSNVELVPVKTQKKSGGMMARLMEAAEKSAQQQQAAKKKKK